MTHVLPVNDEKEHLEDVYCWCDPQLIFDDMSEDKYNEPSEASIVVHNAADCRHIVEDVIGGLVDSEKYWEMT